MVWVRLRLTKIVRRYELRGTGAGQMRLEENDEYRHYDTTWCEAGDD